MNTTVLIILSDGTHRVTSWQRQVGWADVVRCVSEHKSSLVNMHMLTIAVAMGADVVTYKGGFVDEMFPCR